jgi:hypothetical protein
LFSSSAREAPRIKLDIHTIGDDFLKVGDDFLKIGGDFIKVGELSDSPALDSVFVKLGGDFLNIADAVEDAEHGSGGNHHEPPELDGLHQLLQAANDFGLL